MSTLKERYIRWRYRWLYSCLPEFFRTFYPPEKAVKLLVENATHNMWVAKNQEAAANKCINQTIELEKEVAHLKLLLAASQLPKEVNRRLSENLGIDLTIEEQKGG